MATTPSSLVQRMKRSPNTRTSSTRIFGSNAFTYQWAVVFSSGDFRWMWLMAANRHDAPLVLWARLLHSACRVGEKQWHGASGTVGQRRGLSRRRKLLKAPSLLRKRFRRSVQRGTPSPSYWPGIGRHPLIHQGIGAGRQSSLGVRCHAPGSRSARPPTGPRRQGLSRRTDRAGWYSADGEQVAEPF